MASRGFEFAYMLDGSNAVPKTITVTLGIAAAHLPGAVMLIQSDGFADQVTANLAEVTGIYAGPPLASGDITAETTTAELAVVTRNQVWRCSMDATSTAAVIGYTKTLDVASARSIDADDISNGSLTLVATDVDDDGNVMAYVVFSDTTFGNV